MPMPIQMLTVRDRGPTAPFSLHTEPSSVYCIQVPWSVSSTWWEDVSVAGDSTVQGIASWGTGFCTHHVVGPRGSYCGYWLPQPWVEVDTGRWRHRQHRKGTLFFNQFMYLYYTDEPVGTNRFFHTSGGRLSDVSSVPSQVRIDDRWQTVMHKVPKCTVYSVNYKIFIL